jgi:hypothetical protein
VGGVQGAKHAYHDLSFLYLSFDPLILSFLKRKRLSLIHTHIYFMLLSKRLSLSAGFRIVCAEDGHNLGIRRKGVGNSLQAMFDPDQ